MHLPVAYSHGISVGTAVQAPPVVAELEAVFLRLDDAELLVALSGPLRRGPKGYPVKVLWHCFIARYVLDLDSTAALIRTLTNNPYIAAACGLPSPDAIPHEATFSRFFAKLARKNIVPLMKDVSRRLVRKHYETLPGFGQRVALDSTVIKAWSNGGKPKKSDQEAGWAIKKGTQGVKEMTYGWKLHLLVDCEYELPIAAHVSAGNVHDAIRATHVLSEARFTYSRFHPQYLMADKGYSGAPLFRTIRNHYHARPIIEVSAAHKKLLKRLGQEQKTPEWKALYKQRQSVERAFSRLKGQRSLNRVTVRRRPKVTVHCYLALIAMQATGITCSKSERLLTALAEGRLSSTDCPDESLPS